MSFIESTISEAEALKSLDMSIAAFDIFFIAESSRPVKDCKLSKCVSKSAADFPAETNKAPRPAIAPVINPSGPRATVKALPKPPAEAVKLVIAPPNPERELVAPKIPYVKPRKFPLANAEDKPENALFV